MLNSKNSAVAVPQFAEPAPGLSTPDGIFDFEKIDMTSPEWDEFARGQSDCIFFHSLWAEVIERGYGIKTYGYLLKKEGKIRLGLAGSFFKVAWFKFFHANTPYGAFLGELDLVPTFLKYLEADAKEKRIHQIRITQVHGHRYAIPPTYRQHKASQHVLDLGGLNKDEIWAAYKKNARRDVRRSERLGVSVRPIVDRREVEDYYSIYQATMKRTHSYGPHTRSLYQAIYDFLGPKDQSLFLVAQHQREIISGALLIFSQDTAYLLGNASRSDFLRLCPNDLIIHAAIMAAKDRGCRFFDFMTTGEIYHGYEELCHFKEKWGAVRYPFVVYERDLGLFRPMLWKGIWFVANSRLGSRIVRRFYRK